MSPSKGRRRRLALAALGLAALGYGLACLAFARVDPRVPSFELPAEPAPWPEGFLWGTATAAHQIEGGNTLNDWAAFEAVPGNIDNGDRSGAAADHYGRVAEDIALMGELGANAYRFSIEWSRLEPEEGRWDELAWAHYAAELDALADAGITPMVTLLHFTLPQWIAERGGLRAPDFAARFGVFAAEAARRFGPRVSLWCTINEPNVQMYFGYVEGIWPPGERDNAHAAEAFAGALRGHAAAAKALRAGDQDAQIGMAINMIVFEPASRASLPDWIAAREADRGFNWAYYDSIAAGRVVLDTAGFPSVDEPLDELAGSVDYFGVNYYRRNLVRFTPGAPGMVTILPGPGAQTDAGIEIYPEGLLRLLRRVHERYGLPIYVTENGVADADGELRGEFVRTHAHAVALALAEGIDVRGFFHWSLMDNFEWAEGFAHRFGLYRVDYETFERIPSSGVEAFRALSPVGR